MLFNYYFLGEVCELFDDLYDCVFSTELGKSPENKFRLNLGLHNDLCD